MLIRQLKLVRNGCENLYASLNKRFDVGVTEESIDLGSLILRDDSGALAFYKIDGTLNLKVSLTGNGSARVDPTIVSETNLKMVGFSIGDPRR